MIAFRAFTKCFGPQRAVEDLSLAVQPGEVVALLGPNGSGKTTTLKAAAGLILPSSGDVLIGEPGVSPANAAARRACAFLPQRVSFPDALTGCEIVEFHRLLRGVGARRADEVLRFVGLQAAADRAVGTYSGGMVQRLGLAVAVLPDAPILLLDEPSAALDPDGLEAFQELVHRMKREGRTVLFTTHHLDDLETLVDRFAVLVRGRLAALLPASALAARLPGGGTLRLHQFYRDLVQEPAA